MEDVFSDLKCSDLDKEQLMLPGVAGRYRTKLCNCFVCADGLEEAAGKKEKMRCNSVCGDELQVDFEKVTDQEVLDSSLVDGKISTDICVGLDVS